jgi:hypothetical protein
MRVFFFDLTISAFVVCVCSFVHSPLLPPSVVGKVSDELVYISDWYVTISMLAGVAQAHVVNETGPVPSDGHNIWPMVIGAGATPPVKSPRTFIVHEHDDKQGVYAYRSGDWKLIWGKVGTSDWIADISYGSGCTKLLPGPNASHHQHQASVELAYKSAPLETASTGPELMRTYTDTITDPTAASPDDDLKCTADAPCLFNVADDETEHKEQAKQQPGVVKRLQQEYAAYVAHRYMGTLDEAKTSEDDYCAFIKKAKWVQPYDDLPPTPLVPTPPPTPSPPTPAPPPLPANVVQELNGTWIQNWDGKDHKGDKKPQEWMSVIVNATNHVVIRPINCSGCCWNLGVGHVVVTDADAPLFDLQIHATGPGSPSGSKACTKDEHGTAEANKKAPGGVVLSWGSWSSWAKAG